MNYEWMVALAVQTILFLAGGYGMVLKNDWSNKALERRLDQMSEELKGLAVVITTQAVQTNRLDNMDVHIASLDRRVEDLRRGNGYVRGSRSGIDGEYSG